MESDQEIPEEEITDAELNSDFKHGTVAKKDKLNVNANDRFPYYEKPIESLRKKLKENTLNKDGSPQSVMRRCWLFKKLDSTINDVDVQDIENARAERGILLSHMKPDFRDFFDVAFYFLPKIKGVNENIVSEEQLIELQKLLFDARIPSRRQTKEEIELELECSKKLQFGREDINELPFDQLRMKIPENHRSAEYEGNEVLLRSNMKLVLSRLKKAKLAKRKEALLEKQIPIPKCLDDVSFEASPLDEIEAIEQNEDRIQNVLDIINARKDRLEKEEKDPFENLPSISNEAAGYLRDVAVHLSSDVREIGIKSSGTYTFGKIVADDIDLPEGCIEIRYHEPNSEIGKSGKPLEQFLDSLTPDNRRLKYLYFRVEEELFQFDIKLWELVNQTNSSFFNLVCANSEMSAKSLNDDINNHRPRIIAKRMILQVKPRINPEKIRELLQRIKLGGNKVVESGPVLNSTLAFVVQERRDLDQSPYLVYNTSSNLRSIVPSLNYNLRKWWEHLANYTDPLVATQANEILIDLMLAGPRDKAAAVVTEVLTSFQIIINRAT